MVINGEFLDHFPYVHEHIKRGAGFLDETEPRGLLSSTESQDEPAVLIEKFNNWLKEVVKPEIQMHSPEEIESPKYEISGHARYLILAMSRIVDGRGAIKEKIREILKLMQELSGYDTVAITTKKQNEFVFYASAPVRQAEKIKPETEQQKCSDESACSTFQCICGAELITEAGDVFPHRTELGSFWINSSEQFACLSREISTSKNHCNRPGIESIARIPLAINGERAGILHLNDHRKNRFALEEIYVFEIIGTTIAMLLQQELTEEQLHEKALRLYNFIYYDSITKLPNRFYLEKYFKAQLPQGIDNKEKFALILIDMDRFKRIIDTFGDEICNEVLCTVAQRLKRIVGSSGTVSRWEGDVFVLVVEKPNSLIIIEAMVRDVLKLLRMPFNAENHDFYLTASIGIANFPEDGRDLVALVRSASVAMNLAKSLGGNGYRFCTPEMKTSASELKTMEKTLRAALKEQQFLLHYQPQMDLLRGDVVGFEALLRWQHPTKGMLLPDKFIPLAEKTGLIIPIGEWVLQTACKQNKRWQYEGFNPVKMAVNISAQQFQQNDFHQVVSKALDSAGLDPQFLELEITESNIMKSGEDAIAVLNNLKSTGLRIAIDDFGSGYSSLAYLKDFPIDTLKIDQSFIRDVTIFTKNAAIVKSIIAMASNMDIKVIAEGIETKEQRVFLRDEGCEFGQGFFVGRPAPAEEVVHLMKSTRNGVEPFSTVKRSNCKRQSPHTISL